MQIKRYLNRNTISGLLLILTAFALFSYFIVNFEWDFVDWTQVFYPAARTPLHPYFPFSPERAFYYYNPPWMVWILFPLTLFPAKIALAAWLVLTVLLTMWCVTRLGGGLYEALLVLCSPIFVRLIVHGQIDIVALLGFTLLVTATGIYKKGVGLLLMAIKPQVLFLGAVVYWLNLPHKDKLRILLPLVIVILTSFLLIGNWPIKVYELRHFISQNANISIWPYGIPIGLVMLVISIKKKDVYVAGLSTYFFTPYLVSHSLFAYSAVLFTQLSKKWSTVLFLLLWILSILAS